MSNVVKFILFVVLGIIALSVVLNLVSGLLALLFKIVVPLLIIGGVGYLVYRVIDRKALGRGPRSIR